MRNGTILFIYWNSFSILEIKMESKLIVYRKKMVEG